VKRTLLFLLCRTAAAANIPAQTDLLRKSGQAVERLWEQLSAVNCIESVQQEKLSPAGKSVFRQQSDFDYIAILQITGSDILVDESRSTLREPGKDSGLPLLITNGFSTFALIFHPFYQGAFEYGLPERVTEDGREFLAVKFRHIEGARSPSVLKLRNREYPIDWQGTAWLDPLSGAVVRVSAELGKSMEDIGLKTLRADVRYAAVEFKEEAGAHWLPTIATIEVETPRQRWRNLHTFTNYKLFSVGVKNAVGAAK
jgi:hypothetical protein